LLHFVAYLPEIDLEVLRHAGYSKAKAVVEALRDRVAFIYVDRPNLYRCHDLFRDFLQHQLELEGDSAVEKTQRRVASALETHGDFASALKIYTELRSETDVLRLLECHGFKLIDHAHGDTVSVALDRLSHEARAVKPIVLALRAVREAHNGRFDRAESLFERALKAESNAERFADLAVRLATILFNQRREIAPLLEPLLRQAISDESRVAALSLLMLAYANMAKKDDTLQAIAHAQQYVGAIESNEVRARLLYRMGLAKMTLAFPADEVSALFLQAQALALENAVYLTGAAALLGLAYVAMFYDDDVTKSVWYAQQSANAAQKAGDRYSIQNAVVHLMLLETIRGGSERLPALEQQFLSITTSDSARTAFIIPTRAMMASWDGRFDEAHRLGAMWPEPVFDFDRVHAAAIRAIYALGANSKQQAQEYVARALTLLETAHLPHIFARRRASVARMLCAIAEALMGRLTNAQRIAQRERTAEGPAIDAMKDVVLAVCRMAKNRSFTDDVLEALEQLKAVGHGGLSKTLERLIEKWAASSNHAETLLTRAEMEVLSELGQGRSPKEIATATGRSVYTVQAHIQNIIKKLGCSGRNEAMTVARKRGLLA
jgi:ATP/maltotriose-dependent transcriptional regulator MalT